MLRSVKQDLCGETQGHAFCSKKLTAMRSLKKFGADKRALQECRREVFQVSNLSRPTLSLLDDRTVQTQDVKKPQCSYWRFKFKQRLCAWEPGATL